MAIGAKVRVTAGNLAETSEVRAGGSYISSNDPRLHFGLASEAKMDEVSIRWPSGEKENLEDPRRGFLLHGG
jgi:enediyne biosynthesis protein E4